MVTRLRTRHKWWSRARPTALGLGELAAALGGVDPVEALRGTVLAAMPTVSRFEEDPPADLVARADEVAAHRFDLLGSGPTELGPEIDWLTDFKSGRRWPLHHGSLLRLAYGDGSDIKVPWELSRCQHLASEVRPQQFAHAVDRALHPHFLLPHVFRLAELAEVRADVIGESVPHPVHHRLEPFV